MAAVAHEEAKSNFRAGGGYSYGSVLTTDCSDSDDSSVRKDGSAESAADLELQAFERGARHGLIVKVYAILVVQLLVSVFMCTIFSTSASVQKFVLTTPSLMYVALFAPFLVIIGIFFWKNRFPHNFICLGLLTLCMSYSLGITCAVTNSSAVLGAAVMTTAVFVGLTLYVFYNQDNFEWMWPMLWSGLCVMLVAGLLQLFFPSFFAGGLDLLMSIFGALLFSGFIVYDTWLLKEKYTADDYIIAALELYLDIVNLFIFLLRLLSREK
eukprot:gnl/Spiro4/11297_TR5957_c0_g1_i1.p1 gnl/Spiro4/11297_TR5957_c0_g1~~gnl/Spiro4/11297_TR5957_c0_g1_i1.p1  ORF type:complete len:294 (+),score=69.59 gnl/Spiro4/11297_TR5957_c0_g1_i1:81-884(+)